jgi:hypothetical protein
MTLGIGISHSRRSAQDFNDICVAFSAFRALAKARSVAMNRFSIGPTSFAGSLTAPPPLSFYQLGICFEISVHRS